MRSKPWIAIVAVLLFAAVGTAQEQPATDPCEVFCIRAADLRPLKGFEKHIVAGSDRVVYTSPQADFGPEVARSAEFAKAPNGKAGVLVHLTSQGRSDLEKYTRSKVRHTIAIFVGGKLVVAPRVTAPFTDQDVVIAGDLTQTEAIELATKLNAALQSAHEPSARRARPDSRASGFDFYSGMWINLHHQLLAGIDPTSGDPSDDLIDSEKTAWNESLNFYRERFRGKSAAVDPELIRIDDALSRLSDDSYPSEIDPAVAEALDRAAVVYRRCCWSQDNRTNRFWISVAGGMLRRLGDDLAAENARALGTEWPRNFRVDLIATAHTPAAWATGSGESTHLMLSSVESGNQGFNTLESLFREAAGAVVEPLRREIAARAERLHVSPPPDLADAIVTYTAGVFTRQSLESRGVTGWISEAQNDPAVMRWRDALDAHWAPHLRGDEPLGDAINGILSGTKETQ